MADEILVLEGNRQDRYQLLMLFPIDGLGGNPSALQAGGANVVPSPVPRADGLNPDWPFTLLSAAELAALDGGTLAYRIVPMGRAAGLTSPQLIAQAQGIYAAQHADVNAEYQQRYRYIGQRVNAS